MEAKAPETRREGARAGSRAYNLHKENNKRGAKTQKLQEKSRDVQKGHASQPKFPGAYS